MRVMVISIVIDALGTVPKKLKKQDWRNWKSQEESRPPRPQHC